MSAEALTPENTTIILIDYAIGFANVVRSHDITDFQRNVQLLARTALDYKSGLVVTNGPPQKSSGPYYPNLLKQLGDHPIIIRGGMFNAFLFPEFADAVAATQRKNVVVGGVTTEGCAMQTAFGALRAGYNVHIAVDACGGQTRETHETAIQRMIGAGIVPVTAFSLAGEFQVDQDRPGAERFFKLTADFNPEMTFQTEIFQYAQTVEKEKTSQKS